MRIRIYQVDAFTNSLFGGNPAAVCPLDNWIPDEAMQAIAAENNLSETAFFAIREHPFNIRWFTPATEVELCGHATLATAHVLYKHLEYRHNPIHFHSLSGPLNVIVEGENRYTLDFPMDQLQKVAPQIPVLEHFSEEATDVWQGKTDLLIRVKNEEAVRKVKVDFDALKEAGGRGFIVTSEGADCDYVARCFYPQTGINEDPATGSSQTSLAVYWSGVLGKKHFTAKQLSARGASFETELRADRVLITGTAVSYMEGVIEL